MLGWRLEIFELRLILFSLFPCLNKGVENTGGERIIGEKS